MLIRQRFWVESLLFIGAGVGQEEKNQTGHNRTGSATLNVSIVKVILDTF